MKQDQMSMAASLESRAPFLDHKLVEFATGKLVPVDTGGKIRSYNILRKLAGRLEEYPARKLSCARRSLLTRFGALPELRTQAAFSPRKSSFHARRWRMLTGGLDSSSLVKTALSDLSHLKTAAESKPVAEAFSGGVEIIERFARVARVMRRRALRSAILPPGVDRILYARLCAAKETVDRYGACEWTFARIAAARRGAGALSRIAGQNVAQSDGRALVSLRSGAWRGSGRSDGGAGHLAI